MTRNAYETPHRMPKRLLERPGTDANPMARANGISSIVPKTPSKVEQQPSTKTQRYKWYQDTFILFDATIVGPFDF